MRLEKGEGVGEKVKDDDRERRGKEKINARRKERFK